VSGALVLEGIAHRYDVDVVVRDVSLSVGRGEVVCLLGPSGCGKTTVLRLAAGLETLQQGEIRIAGRRVAGHGRNDPPEARGVGIVFQDYALFPHLTVEENVRFGVTRRDKNNDPSVAAREALSLVGMLDFTAAYPHMLSGGQQQRVALARALAPRPPVLLLDEPFSGLDARLRDAVRDEALHILKESGTAVLMVTHDPEEAMFMADRIAVMHEGHVEQVGSPSDIYFAPATAFVAGFLGDVNRLPGMVKGGAVDTPLGSVPAGGFPDGTTVELLIRPEALQLRKIAPGAGPPSAVAKVLAARLLGRTSLIHLCMGGGTDAGNRHHLHLHSRMPGRYLPEENEKVAVALDRSLAFVFPAPGGAAENGRLQSDDGACGK